MGTNIGDSGRVGDIQTFDDPRTKPIPGLMGLLNSISYGKDELGLEAAEALRTKCPAVVHKIAIEDDAEPD